jgi:hypothetical protein
MMAHVRRERLQHFVVVVILDICEALASQSLDEISVYHGLPLMLSNDNAVGPRRAISTQVEVLGRAGATYFDGDAGQKARGKSSSLRDALLPCFRRST